MGNNRGANQRFIITRRRQGSFSATLTLGTLLLTASGLLCSCHSTAWQAKRQETEGQRLIPNEYAQMRKKTFTEDQWLELLRQRVHQPKAVWRGTSTATISESGVGLAFPGLNFHDSTSHLLEHQLFFGTVLTEHPLLFVRLFDDPDPETVLTGARVYYQGPWPHEPLDEAVMNTVAKAIREELLGHMDVRVRYAAIYTLAKCGRLTAQDIQRGLDDESNEVRVTTAFCLAGALEQWDREYEQATKNASRAASAFANAPWRRRDAILAAALLDHLNDNDPYVRQTTSVVLRRIFRRRLDELQAAGLQDPAALPARFDWVRSDWHTRCATQTEWKQWWTQRGMALGK